MIKTSKDLILELLKKKSASGVEALETIEIANELGMQRTNVSAILNALVHDGLITKTQTRPVYYSLPQDQMITDPFLELIGQDGSLENAIKLSKAAVLYPGKSLNCLLIGPQGSGKTRLAKAMFDFAKQMGKIPSHADYVKINCRHYANNKEEFMDVLFGQSERIQNSNLIEISEGSILVIENIDMLEGRMIARISEFIDSNSYINSQGLRSENRQVSLILTMDDKAETEAIKTLVSKVPVKIELPDLNQRSLQERLELILHFLKREAANTRYDIVLSKDCIVALLTSVSLNNLKYLITAIKIAVASAYLRVYDIDTDTIEVVLEDFDPVIQNALHKDKSLRNHVESNLELKSIYRITYKSESVTKDIYHQDLYKKIDDRIRTLTASNLGKDDIATLITGELQEIVKAYKRDIRTHDINLNELGKVVDKRIIDCVKDLMNLIESHDHYHYPSAVFYGLCLHIQGLVKSNRDRSMIDIEKLRRHLEPYAKEVGYAKHLVTLLVRNLDIEIDDDETMVLAMFLAPEEESDHESYPQLLIAMHGDHSASSIANVINQLVQVGNTYSYDMPLNQSSEASYRNLKDTIQSIDQGAGVVVMYDMGSLKQILERIAIELDVQMRLIYMPITLIGIDASRKLSMEHDIDKVYHTLMSGIRNEFIDEDTHKMAIITLCHTGEGGAVEIKNYLKENYRRDIKIYPLAISERKQLVKEVLKIRKYHDIKAFVGTYDPKIFGIPFVPVSHIFSLKGSELDRVILDNLQPNTVDFEQMLDYLSADIDLDKEQLRKSLPEALDQLDALFGLSLDQRVGLFLHIGTLMNRLVHGISLNNHPDIKVDEKDILEIQNALSRLERRFKVIIPDAELAIIHEICKKGN